MQRARSDIALKEQGTARPSSNTSLPAKPRTLDKFRVREREVPEDAGEDISVVNGPGVALPPCDTPPRGHTSYGGGSAFAALATDVSDEDEPTLSKRSLTRQSSKLRSPSIPLPEEMPSLFADGASLQDLLSMLQSKGGERIPSFRAPSFSALQHMQQQLRALSDAGRLSDAISEGSEIPKQVAEQVEELLHTELSLRTFDSTNLPDLPALLQSLGSGSAPYALGAQPGQKEGDGGAGAAGNTGDQQGAPQDGAGEGQAPAAGPQGPPAGLQVGAHGGGLAEVHLQQQEELLQGQPGGPAGLTAGPFHANAGPAHASPLPSPHGR